MTLRAPLLWRLAAALLWIVSIGCLSRAIVQGVTAEESRYNPQLTESDRVQIRHDVAVSDRWGDVGWALQAITAGVLSLGIETARMVRRVFISLGILIAADGMSLLLVAVIVR